jgi:bifunctional non-homologous end joining protein LigD
MKKSLQKKRSAHRADEPETASHVQHEHADPSDLAALATGAGGVVRVLDAAKLRPMLCDKSAIPLDRPGFLYELKLDGVRILAEKVHGRAATGPSRLSSVELYYRSGRNTSAAYPEIAEAVAALPVKNAILDGEIIAFDESGLPSFQRLQSRIMGQRKSGAPRARERVQVAFVAFDVLSIEGVDVTHVPLVKRRALLDRIVPESGVVSRFPQVRDDATALYAMCKERGLEGLVAKDPNGLYAPGARSAAWAKIRIERSGDFVVVGYAKGDADRHGIKALTLASFEDGRYVGRGDVGSGLTDDDLRTLKTRLDEMIVKEPPALKLSPGKERVFVRPELVVRVRFLMISEDGSVRQPVFAGVRPDISPEDCSLGE